MKIKKPKFDIKDKVMYNYKEMGTLVEPRVSEIYGVQVLIIGKVQTNRYLLRSEDSLVNENDVIKKVRK